MSRVFVLIVVVVFSWQASARQLEIFFANDIHGHLNADGDSGFSRMCTIVRNQRKKAGEKGDDTLFVVSGDLFQGTLISHVSRGAAEFQALAACGVDAIVVGNHDFDYGLSRILQLASNAKFPVLCANCRYRGTGKLLFKPWVRLGKGANQLFLLGLITPDTPRLTSALKDMKRLRFQDPVKVLKRYKHRKNLIILSHLGFSADKALVDKVDTHAVILGGHSHTVLKRCVIRNGVPICQAGSYARYVGVLRLKYGKKGLEYVDSRLIPVTKDTVADKAVVAALKPWNRKLTNQYDKPIGTSSVTMRANGWAMHTRETAIGDLVCDAMLESSAADAGFVNAGGIRGDLKKGAVTYRDIYRILPFDNRVYTLKIRGKDLRRLLRHIAKKQGKNGFMQVCGMSIVVNSSGKVRRITVHGKPLDRTRTYTISTIGFLIRGGDGYGFLRHYSPHDTGILLREAMKRYVQKHSPIKYPPQGRWLFGSGL